MAIIRWHGKAVQFRIKAGMQKNLKAAAIYVVRKVKESLAGLGDTLDRASEKVSVQGTFNAAAIRSLEAGTAADRTAKATEETAKNTKKIVKAAEEGGLVFS